MKKSYEFDQRKNNPGLHMLYTKTAIIHLVAIRKMLKKLYSFANTNMTDMIIAIHEQEEKLIETSAAYAEANEILTSISQAKNSHKE